VNTVELVLGSMGLAGSVCVFFGVWGGLLLWQLRAWGVLMVALERRSGALGYTSDAIPAEDEFPWWKGTDLAFDKGLLNRSLPPDLAAVRAEANRRGTILMLVMFPVSLASFVAGMISYAIASGALR